MDRVDHLLDVIRFLDNDVADPTGIGGPRVVSRLEQNYPNPFNPSTTIRYSLARDGHVSLRVYDVAGRLVRTLVDDSQVPLEGGFAVTWDGTNDLGPAGHEEDAVFEMKSRASVSRCSGTWLATSFTRPPPTPGDIEL
jgi:hypothetical protein